MARNMTSTTVYLTPEQLRELRRLSERTGLPQSVLIRRGVNTVIDETRLDDATVRRHRRRRERRGSS
jgi:predicted DNA-binding protein